MGILFTEERLCLQILHGKVSAFVEKDGKCLREYIFPEVCDNPSDWASHFAKMMKALHFRGTNVSIVLSDARTHFLVVPTPPMKPKDLQVFLTRKAHQEWKERTPMRFAWTELRVRDGKSVLLQIVPEEWIQILVTTCRDYGLQPLHIFTANAAAIRHLDIPAGVTGLVALDTGYSALFVVSKGGDAPVLVRELSVSWKSEIDGPVRVAQEIQRTQLFAKQQLGAPIERIQLLGEGSSLLAQVAEKNSGAKPEANESRVMWAFPLQKRMKSATDNLLTSRELRHNAEKYHLVITVFLTVVALIALSLSAMRMNTTLSKMDREIVKGQVQQTINDLNGDKEVLSLIQTEIQSNYALGSTIAKESHRPIPGWLAGVISDLVPDGMVLTQFWVHADTTGAWILEVGGQIPRNPIQSEKMLHEFQERIAALPAQYEELKSWKLVWVENLKYGSSWEPDDSKKRFLLQGVIR